MKASHKGSYKGSGAMRHHPTTRRVNSSSSIKTTSSMPSYAAARASSMVNTGDASPVTRLDRARNVEHLIRSRLLASTRGNEVLARALLETKLASSSELERCATNEGRRRLFVAALQDLAGAQVE